MDYSGIDLLLILNLVSTLCKVSKKNIMELKHESATTGVFTQF